MKKRSIIRAASLCVGAIIVVSVFFGFGSLLEAVFGCCEAVSYIGRIGGAILASLVILCIKSSRDDEKELDRLRELEKGKREDRE